jgi:hypothetical protein
MSSPIGPALQLDGGPLLISTSSLLILFAAAAPRLLLIVAMGSTAGFGVSCESEVATASAVLELQLPWPH